MTRSLKDQLKQWKKEHMKDSPRKVQHKNNTAKKKEGLSSRDIQDLMGTNMKTLRRGKGGAYK
jgi:hypothetical protein